MASVGRTKRGSKGPQRRSAAKRPTRSTERVPSDEVVVREDVPPVVPEFEDASSDLEPPTIPMERDFAESSSSVEPEDLGRRFLRDATELEGSPASGGESGELGDEPATGDVDLLTDSIHEASLFDQPTERGTRAPHVRADETASVDDDARAQAHRNTRAVLAHGRSRAERRPHR